MVVIYKGENNFQILHPDVQIHEGTHGQKRIHISFFNYSINYWHSRRVTPFNDVRTTLTIDTITSGGILCEQSYKVLCNFNTLT